MIVTMGCGDTCPVYPGKRYLDWELEDPDGLPVEQVRPIVDEIDRRVQALLAEGCSTCFLSSELSRRSGGIRRSLRSGYSDTTMVS